MQYVTGRGNAFFAFDKETDATADDQRHLFVRMGVLRRGQQRRESKAADHQILTDDHLTLDAFRRMLDWNTGPIQMLRRSERRSSFGTTLILESLTLLFVLCYAVSTGSGSDRVATCCKDRDCQDRYPVATAPGTDLIRRAPRTASM